MRVPLFLLLVVALFPAAALQAQDSSSPEPVAAGDPTVVEFILPGHFKEALAASTERNRCLLVKGVAFGVDAAGAVCATKGHW